MVSSMVVKGKKGFAPSGNVLHLPDQEKKTKNITKKKKGKRSTDTVLTVRQRDFCDQYLIDLNGTQAAIRAGYSAASATTLSCRLLKMDKVQQYLEQKRRKLEIKTEMSAQYVLENLKDVAERCLAAKPVLNMAGKPVVDENGNPVYRFDSAGANKALELIGKHLGVFNADQAGTSRVVLEVQVIREALMQEQEEARAVDPTEEATEGYDGTNV